MEIWFIIILSFCVAAIIKLLLESHNKKLPPGPSILSSNFILLTKPAAALGPVLKELKAKYGTLITLLVGSHPFIFVGEHKLAHQLLIQNGAVFSDRPRTYAVRNISSCFYGPTWRVLRRNLTSEALHPSRVKPYAWARKWVLHILVNKLREHEPEEAGGVKVNEHFTYAMFCLLVSMCFGEKFDETRIKEIASVQRRVMLVALPGRFDILGLFPRLGKILLRNKWKKYLETRKDQDQTLLPLIEARIESVKSKSHEEHIVAYVDTLVNLQLPEGEGSNENNGKLTHKEMVTMCGEFLAAGTDTTATALQWIMANLVKHPEIQSKLYDEIVGVVGPPPQGEEELGINEEDLHKMPYLKAVILEGLRRHPPGHLVLPHRIMKEVEVQGYVFPQGATINFLVSEMGLDPKVWDNPMEFKPERFLANDGDNGVFDIIGSKGIKMMPFGAGRRICPGLDLALLHLEYFVANLIWYLEWGVPNGYNVDLSEKVEFTTVMKNPLQAKISSRAEKLTI